MLPSPQSFSIYPSVILADKKTKMTIAPNERAYILVDGAKYQVKIIAVDSDEDYYEPKAFALYDVVADGGVITFEHYFEREQEHNVILLRDGETWQSFAVYSVYEDLYALKPLKGDLHSHSCRSDGTRDPATQFGHYREHGFDFVALTDHNRYYPGEEIDDVYAGVKTGITRVKGEEIHSPGSVVHMVHVGGERSVADSYVLDREKYEEDVKEYEKKVPKDVPERYKPMYAKAMLATDTIHKAGGLAIFPHPYWRPGRSKAYNVTNEFSRILLKSGMFDAYELIGAMEAHGNNLSVALWSELRAQGYDIPVVGSSDTHSLRKERFSYSFTICFAKENTNSAIIEAVKNKMSVAGDVKGDGYDRECYCYGDARLVSYAHFLVDYYFPEAERIGAGIGVAMRAYAMEECGAELIEAQNELLEKYRGRFFGSLAPSLPSEKVKAFEEKHRSVQITRGPRTRGSSVDATPAKTLITV